MGKKITEMHNKRMEKSVNYRNEYNALEDEFSLAEEVIRARRLANLTQQQLAKKMNTTQQVIARLEGGSLPSIKTLERLAAATGTHLRVRFESVVK
jgi:ribosome-binding protein aMBF1 (putative translation factor)